VQSFALAHRLTPAETGVLQGLCGGRSPLEIAHAQCVAISTVRTQISSIRAKTGADSIRDLVQQVATLPPLVSALRQSRCARPVGLPQPAEA
jgi:DNA-binding CsgD family transcriptional regulator